MPKGKKGNGVREIANPARAGDLEITVLAIIFVGAVFLPDQKRLDAQITLPVKLDGFGNFAVALGVVEKDFQRGEIGAVGEASGREQAAGLVETFTDFSGLIIAATARGDEAVGRLLATCQDAVGDELTIQAKGEGFSHTLIGKRACAGVYHVVIGAEVRR